jgi:hypothetical protein
MSRNAKVNVVKGAEMRERSLRPSAFQAVRT